MASQLRYHGLAHTHVIGFFCWYVLPALTDSYLWPRSESMEAVGLRNLASKHVLSSFEKSGVVAQRVVARINTNRFAQVNSTKGTWSLLQDINLTSGTQSDVVRRAEPGALPASSAAVAQQIQLGKDEISAMVRAIATEILGESQLDSNGQFPPGGFDSLSAVEFSNKIGKAAGVDLASTLVFDYPSVPAIAGFLMEKLAPASARSGKKHCTAGLAILLV